MECTFEELDFIVVVSETVKSHRLKPAKIEQANNNKSFERNADGWEKTPEEVLRL